MGKSEAVFANIKAWTAEKYGEPHQVLDSSVTYINGSTFVLVKVSDLGENVMVIVGSPIGIDVPVSGELAKHLLLEHDYNFGSPSMRINDDGRTGTVTLRTMLIGDELDREEIYTAMELIAGTADSVDDQLVKRFGGRTVIAS